MEVAEEQEIIETDEEVETDAVYGFKPHAGQEIMSWIIDEYVRHERGPVWYLVAIVIALAMMVYALLSQNFLFAIIIIMFGVIAGLSMLREPNKIIVVITDLGVGFGDKFYPFKAFRNFWILYEPPEVKNVYLEFRGTPFPHLVVPIDDQNPVEVRSALVRFLDEDLEKDEEPVSDFVTRIFRL